MSRRTSRAPHLSAARLRPLPGAPDRPGTGRVVVVVTALVALLVGVLPVAAGVGGAAVQAADGEPDDGSFLGHNDPDRPTIPGAVPDEERPIRVPSTTPDTDTDTGSADLAITPDTRDADGAVRTGSDGFAVRQGVRGTGEIRPDIRIHGRGWGHSVGFSQFGAYAQALDGRGAEEILTSYYPGTEVTTDERASDDRIRAGIATNQTSTPILALDDEVTWRICTPEEDPVGNGRVPEERCANWFTQAPDERLRVRPLPADGSATPVGSHTHTGDDLQRVEIIGDEAGEDAANGDTEDGEAQDAANGDAQDAANGDAQDASNGDADSDDGAARAPVPAPAGGILIERASGEDEDGDPVWEPHRAYVTPDDDRSSTTFPVARAVHGDGRIEAQSYAPPERRYRSGWRDFHLTGTSGSDPDSFRLTIVQDVDSVEEYLRGLAEVPSSWPSASLEAQAIAGRTYALLGSRGGSCFCDRLSTAADQVFIGESKVEEPGFGERWAEAVRATADQVLTFDDDDGTKLAQTFYSSSFGGRSENIEDSWAFYRAYQRVDDDGELISSPASYLRSVDDPWSLREEVNGVEISNSRRNWTAVATQDAFLALVNRERDEPFERIERLGVGERTEGGSPRTIEVTGVTEDGDREAFTYRGLFSGTQELARPIAANTLRIELPLIDGIESNGRISSTQIQRFGFGPFTDDDGSVHEYAITWAATAGIVQGVSEDRFEPGSPVTRAQMATFLDNTFSLPRPDSDAQTFPDVPVGSTHHRAVEAIAAAGITLGYDDGTYRPGDTVRRQELAAFLARAQALTAGADDDRPRFDDVPASSTHADSISAVARAGITAGCDEDRFCPTDPVTRGQLATFMYRAATR